ncbi:hypothetical protein ACLKA6_019179 [Drosophila palustris]
MGNGVPVDAIRRAERQASLVTWQVRWDSATNGRWTHQLIPKVEEWLNRVPAQVQTRGQPGVSDLPQRERGPGARSYYCTRSGEGSGESLMALCWRQMIGPD